MSRKKSHWWQYLISLVVILIYICPFYVLIMMSCKTITDGSGHLALPNQWYFGNYLKVLFQSDLLRAFRNSLIITVATVGLEVVIACMAAYPLARTHSKLNKGVSTVFMGVMMIPSLSILVGVYSVLVSMHAISTYWGIVVVSVAFGLPMPIYLYTNFIRSLPIELDEASAIDGCTPLQTFFKIILPELKPVTASVLILNGVGMWNEYGYSLYILQKPKMYTLTLLISQYFSSSSVSDLNGAAAAACVAIAPVVLVYLFLQRYFVQGLTDGAVKG